MIDIADLLTAWADAPLLSSAIPETGTIHRTYLLTTTNGRYALRAYRYSERKPIEREHRLIVYAHSQGIPAIAPLALSTGETILERAGHYYALFPFAPGRHVRRGTITGSEVVGMGRCLAQLHLALHAYPHERVAQRSLQIERAKVLARLDQLEAIIRALPSQNSSDKRILARLVGQRAWLMCSPFVDPTQLSQLSYQVLHGDYQDANLFFDGDIVCAVIDWDQSYTASRAWEVVRTLHYVFSFEASACQLFLQAYRALLPLSWEELELSAACYCSIREHDTWMYEAIYLRHDDRLRPYINEGCFEPMSVQWQRVRASLCDT
jgi:homoserine kinase type II